MDRRPTGFALVYDSLEDALDCEPKYRLVRVSEQIGHTYHTERLVRRGRGE